MNSIDYGFCDAAGREQPMQIRIIQNSATELMVCVNGTVPPPPEGDTPWSRHETPTAMSEVMSNLQMAINHFDAQAVVWPNGKEPTLTGHDFLSFSFLQAGFWVGAHSGDYQAYAKFG